MAQVCKSFNNALKDDILPWLNIIVDENHQRSRISDEILVKIASKAMGRLRTLVLSNCDRVTNDGVQTVVAMNPNIEKVRFYLILKFYVNWRVFGYVFITTIFPFLATCTSMHEFNPRRDYPSSDNVKPTRCNLKEPKDKRYL